MNLHALTEHQVAQKTRILRRWLPSRGNVLVHVLAAGITLLRRTRPVRFQAWRRPVPPAQAGNLIAYQGRLTDRDRRAVDRLLPHDLRALRYPNRRIRRCGARAARWLRRTASSASCSAR